MLSDELIHNYRDILRAEIHCSGSLQTPNLALKQYMFVQLLNCRRLVIDFVG